MGYKSRQEEDYNKNADIPEAESAAAEEAGLRGQDDSDNVGGGEGEDADAILAARRLQILDGDEADDCQDFYYISKGWGVYLEYRHALPLEQLLDKVSQEKNVVTCNTNFYKLTHTSGKPPKHKCRMQIPKTDAFSKVGTVLVLMRTQLEPDEAEFPDPDDKADEHFLSQDGKNVWGTYWLNKERERWSLLPSGIVNKRTRVIFETDQLTTFIVVQLKTGSQKWEPESEDEVSSEDESEKDKTADEVELPPVEPRPPRASIFPSPVPTVESIVSEKKPKKKKGESLEMLIDYGDDDLSAEEDELAQQTVNDDDQTALTEIESVKGSTVHSVKLAEDPSIPVTGIGTSAASQQHPPSENALTEVTEDEKSDENTSNIYRPGAADAVTNNEPDANKNNNASKQADDMNENNRNNNEKFDEDDDDNEFLAPEERTVFKNLDPAASSYAMVVGVPYKTEAVQSQPPEIAGGEKTGEESVEEQEGEEAVAEASDEDLPVYFERVLSIARTIEGKTVLQTYKFTPPLTEIGLHESEEAFVKNAVALMWRYRNHREATAAVFSRARDGGFDMVTEIVRTDDLYVRAEHWWSQDYKMVAESATFPLKSGRLFSFALDGTMIVESPPGSSPGYIVARSIYCYLSQINSLQYFVRKGGLSKEDEKTVKKGPRKKEDAKADNVEPDAILEITGFPRGTRTNGVDIAVIPIALAGPDLWFDRHVELRQSDNILLSRLVKFLRRETDLTKRWWKVVIFLGYPEKMVEAEKGKNKPSIILASFLKKWFDDNLNSRDRGILALISILNTMGLESTINGVVTIIKEYKSRLLSIKRKPRYLKLLFHWVIQTKITRNSLIRLLDPEILKPVSDIFLLRLAELLKPELLYKIGAGMDIEDNVIHAIAAEEVITEPEYLPFRVFIKSRQKKDEIIHYTLLLMHMVKHCGAAEAKNFVVRETKKWMETVADTEPEICAKLHNIFD